MAMKKVHRKPPTPGSAHTNDSFVNVGARLGFGAGSQQDGSRYQVNYVSRNRQNLEAAYRTNWVAGMVIDLVADDMTRAGIDIQDEEMDPGDISLLHRDMETLGIWKFLKQNVQWANLYGGSIAVLLIDGQDMKTPLNLDSVGVGAFKGLAVLDRWQIQPSLERPITEFGPNLGMPKFYQVTPGASVLVDSTIHYTRVIRLDGVELPWFQKIAENGWGQSVLERLYDRMIAFDSTTEGIAQLVYKAHLRTLSLPGFREIVAQGGKALDGVLKQLEFIRQYQTNEGLTVIDGSDEFETHSYTFAGLCDIILQFAQQISGATQIPLVRLFGQSPAGLNSTGESDIKTYHEGIGKRQDAQLRPGVSVVLDVMHRSRFGKPPGDSFMFEFRPLGQLTEEDKANIAKTVAEAVKAVFDAGLVSQKTALLELQHSSRATGIFTKITDEDIEAADDAPPDPMEMMQAEADIKAASAPPGAPANEAKTPN